jgi:hypothetical protein
MTAGLDGFKKRVPYAREPGLGSAVELSSWQELITYILSRYFSVQSLAMACFIGWKLFAC